MATLLCVAISIPAAAQGPAAGVRFRLQLISADSGGAAGAAAKIPAATAPNPLLGKPSMVYVQCVRPDSGKWKRESPECGPRVSESTFKLLAESSVTSDAQGHVGERLTWAGGDAVVELDASDRSVVGSTERLRVKIGFWPRLPKGAAAPQETALRMMNSAATFGKSVMMTVLFKDGAQILLVVPER
ncbi:MAG: hypothetical protein ABIT91_21980 [Gemmatimonadaceae bacterium]